MNKVTVDRGNTISQVVMTNVRTDQQLKPESIVFSKEEPVWSDSNSYMGGQGHSSVNHEPPLCRVCSDKSSGRHYGQVTCEGCKSFFKRSIRRKFDYICRNNRECKVNVEQRNQCQACRFVKCLQVGMKKDAVQGLRSSRYQPDSTLDMTLSSGNSPSDNSVDDSELTTTIFPDSKLTIKEVLNAILQAENSAPIVNVEDFYNQSVHILYSIADWTKKLIYTDQISVADNLLLLQNAWCQLFILNYSLCGLTSKLFCNANSSTQSFLSIQSQMLALNRIPMDAMEYGCLKALVFFNPDTPLLFNSKLVDTAQETVQLALESHIKTSFSDKSRFGRILLRMPYLQRITTKQVLEVFFNSEDESFVKSINELFHRLLTDFKPNERDNIEMNNC